MNEFRYMLALFPLFIGMAGMITIMIVHPEAFGVLMLSIASFLLWGFYFNYASDCNLRVYYEKENTPPIVEHYTPDKPLVQITEPEKAKFDREHNQFALCGCGHEYHRHFDPYEEWAHVGCKYCPCDEFENTGAPKSPPVLYYGMTSED